MISIKSNEELETMKKSGAIAAAVMQKTLSLVKPGISKSELDKIAGDEIKRLGGEFSFTTVAGYNWPTCITVNDEVVHGIPNDDVVKEGDLVSVDLGVVLSGLHTDMARTVFVGKPNRQISKFIKTGKKALKLAIAQAQPGKCIQDISAVIQKTVEGENYSVVRVLVGHGIGRNLHEDPQVPGFVTGGHNIKLKVGMTIAIEVIYTAGKPDVVVKDDGWTVVTKDGSLAGLFEDTVAVTRQGPFILTKVN